MSGFEALLAAARPVVAPRQLTESAACGSVGAAMLTAGQSEIVRMVAVNRHGAVLAHSVGVAESLSSSSMRPNANTLVMIGVDSSIALRELLPFR